MKSVNIAKTSTLLPCLWSILLIGFLSSCSNNSASNSQYYVLNNQVVNTPEDFDQQSNKQLISVVVNELPRYLNQANLVMQMNQHQLHYAHHHMWAEPLQQGLLKALLVDFNNRAKNHIFIAGYQQASILTLIIDIDRFHVTDTSQVTLSGNYRLADQEGALPINTRSFNFSLDLEQDGYTHAVAKLRELVTLCVDNIVGQLATQQVVVSQ